MTILDVSIVNVALPSIGEALDFSQENLQWVISAYAITFGGFLLLAGARPTCSAAGASSWSGWRSSRRLARLRPGEREGS
jgi:MFS family permease